MSRGNLLQSEPGVARRAAGGRNIALERVIHHHAIRIETPAEGADGTLHALDPAARQAVAIALIVQRDHFFTKNSHQVFPVARVVNIHFGVSSAVSDGEAVQAVVRFRPPAVQHREVQAAVQNDFLAARSRGFQRTPRIVQPDIDTLRQMPADVDVIVFDEDEFVSKLWVAHQLRNLLQDALARFVERMRLSGKHELHRTFRVIDHARYLFDVGQKKIGAFVGSKAARKTNGERIRTEHAFQLLQYAARFVAARSLLDGAAAHKFNHSRLQIEMRLPEFAVVNIVNAFPDFGLAAAQMPSRAKMAIVEAKHLRSQPGRNMDAIGNVSDGNRVLRFT